MRLSTLQHFFGTSCVGTIKTPVSTGLESSIRIRLLEAVMRRACSCEDLRGRMSEGYWAWMEGQLKADYRATGGEPCRICTGPIPSSLAWKLRDRHVCSSRCNETLKRRWKAKIRKGEIPAYEEGIPENIIDSGGKGREPRIFSTLPVTAPFRTSSLGGRSSGTRSNGTGITRSIIRWMLLQASSHNWCGGYWTTTRLASISP
jgi:hypothetical protein